MFTLDICACMHFKQHVALGQLLLMLLFFQLIVSQF